MAHRNISSTSLIAFVGIAPLIAGASPQRGSVPPRPQLVVQITADQLRGDLLERYRSALTRGFARIERGGYWIHHGDVDHAITLSFPGHATLSTGMFPAHHGLTANEWWTSNKGVWAEVDVSADETYKTLDAPSLPGVSPKNLLSTTLGEWIKAANPRAKAVSLGTGNPVPIAYAGHKSDGAYWYNSSINEFTTSTYYTPQLPPWVKTFNRDELARYQKPAWTLTVPSDFLRLSHPDATPPENCGHYTTFPHVYALEASSPCGARPPKQYSRWFDGTPLKDAALFALAARAVDSEKLGQRGVTDYLALDIGATDDVGHAFGPLSLEQLDTLMRLDRELGEFLEHLDTTVGHGKYVLAFSADHGVVDLTDTGGHVQQVTTAEIEALLDRVEVAATAKYDSEEALEKSIVGTLKAAPFVADAYTEERLLHSSNDPYVRLFRNSTKPGFTTDFPLWTKKSRLYHPARYHIVARFKENMIIDAAIAVHGSPYAQDRLVPIIFYGAGINHGERQVGGRTVDVAPTLAAAADIAAPAELDGIVLPGTVKSGMF